MGKNAFSAITLSDEQQEFIDVALSGKNILVDACIGSGKTTAIQYLCDVVSSDKRVLYLTYNRLLKIDAQRRIKNKNVTVTNYHGFAYSRLKEAGLNAGVQDMIQEFLKNDISVPHYDILLIDEYQDIEKEFADELLVIKKWNPEIQIIAVGDMEQKIYDKTTLEVQPFIKEYLGEHAELSFTKCFRLSDELAARLGRIWKKPIIGVNEGCLVEEMTVEQVREFLAEQNPRDVLCLGSRTGTMSKVLNWIEETYPDVWNKKTVYASIQDKDKLGATQPNSKTAIFTTYDSSKGMERKVCVVFDYTESYWGVRIEKPQQNYTILRNVFCVAASRGKEHVIFVNNGEAMLSEETLKTKVESEKEFGLLDITELFDFKFVEDVEECYSLLSVNEIEQKDHSTINVKNRDEMIDLSPCVGIYQEAFFFDGYDIDESIRHYYRVHDPSKMPKEETLANLTVEEKVLWLTSLETKQKRYREQVQRPFITPWAEWQLKQRLSTEFGPDEEVQKSCEILFSDKAGGAKAVHAVGFTDVIKNDTVYELKFVSELQHTHFLQCACYMVALGLEKGILWNTRDNKKFEVTIPDTEAYLDAVIKTVTKGAITKYYEPGENTLPGFLGVPEEKKEPMEDSGNIAVIDTETNWDDKVMSIGVVIADASTLEEKESLYIVLPSEVKRGGMYSFEIRKTLEKPLKLDRKKAIKKLRDWLDTNGADRLFAYNAKFDYNHLEELQDYEWFDIMAIAANIRYNKSIPTDTQVYKTGRMIRGFGVEPIYRMMTGKQYYREIHNAVEDARDELTIMRELHLPLSTYQVARITEESIRKAKRRAKKRNNSRTRPATRVVIYSVGDSVTYSGFGKGTITDIHSNNAWGQLLNVSFDNKPDQIIVSSDENLELCLESKDIQSGNEESSRDGYEKLGKNNGSRFASQEEFQEKISEISNNTIIIEAYRADKGFIKASCKLCGYIWYPRAYQLVEYCFCPKCGSRPKKIKSIRAKVKK